MVDVVAKSKYLRVSPKKVNRVLAVIRNKRAIEGQKILKLLPHSAARYVLKTLNSAIANAEHNNELEKNELVISKAVVSEGIRLKRFRARARGGAAKIIKRTSNIEITVRAKEEK